jgi:hypothetical protein
LSTLNTRVTLDITLDTTQEKLLLPVAVTGQMGFPVGGLDELAKKLLLRPHGAVKYRSSGALEGCGCTPEFRQL